MDIWPYDKEARPFYNHQVMNIILLQADVDWIYVWFVQESIDVCMTERNDPVIGV